MKTKTLVLQIQKYCGGPVLQDLPEAHFHSPKTKAKKHHNVAPCLGFGLGLRHCLGLRRCSFHDYPPQQMQNRFRLCLGAEMLTMNDHLAAANEPDKSKTIQLCFTSFYRLGSQLLEHLLMAINHSFLNHFTTPVLAAFLRSQPMNVGPIGSTVPGKNGAPVQTKNFRLQWTFETQGSFTRFQ